MVTTQRTILVGIIITLNILFTCFAQPEETLFQLILTRRSGNVITFMCRDTATAQPIPDALYFLNGTRLDNFTTLISGASNEGVTFQINRELEGHFTCGNDSLKSNSMSLITIPDTVRLLPNPRPTYAITGKQVQLNCAIPPGRLIQQYYVTWDRSGRTIYQTRRNNPPQSLRLDDRYSVNPSDLSLIIDNVEFEDASDEYHCVYTVVDPNIMLSYTYTSMQSYDIQLVVLGNFSRLNVEITNRRALLFTIELGVRYTQEVRLSLLYTNATNPSQTREVVTSTAFYNSTNITHVEYGAHVPFIKFKVQVRLVLSDDVYGPYNAALGVYDINQATECIAITKIEEQQIIAVGAVLGACLLILLAVVVTMVLCCLKKGNTKVIRTFKKGDDQLIERMDVLLAEIRSAGMNPPTSVAQNNGTGTHHIATDSGSALELGDVKKQKEYGVLISFVSDSLSAALENPQIHDEVKKSVDSVVKKYWKSQK